MVKGHVLHFISLGSAVKYETQRPQVIFHFGVIIPQILSLNPTVNPIGVKASHHVPRPASAS